MSRTKLLRILLNYCKLGDSHPEIQGCFDKNNIISTGMKVL